MRLYAFGNDQHYQDGQGPGSKPGSAKLSPVEVRNAEADNVWCETLSNASVIVKADGHAEAFGGCLVGQTCLGWKADVGEKFPSRMLLPPPVVQVAGTGDHGIALLASGAGATWAANGWGQLGNGRENAAAVPGDENDLHAICEPYFPDLAAFGDRRVVAVDAGANHSGLIFDDGSTAGVGRALSGQVGDGSKVDRYYFTPTLATDVKALACLWNSKLYLHFDGTVSHVGHNVRNESGNGASNAPNLKPTRVQGLEGIVAIAGAGYRGLAIDEHGDLFAWGQLEGSPRKVLDRVSAASVGCYQLEATCLAVRDLEAWGQGRGEFGQHGLGDRVDRPEFEPIGLPASVVAAGEVHGLLLAP